MGLAKLKEVTHKYDQRQFQNKRKWAFAGRITY